MKQNYIPVILAAGALFGIIMASTLWLPEPNVSDSRQISLSELPAAESVAEQTALFENLESGTTTVELSPEEIAFWYGTDLQPITLGNQSLLASIADTTSERQQGLSGTPSIPATIVKLFVFETSSTWGFWMKDMNYPIDIIWLNEDKQVIYFVSNASPDSYPSQFEPSLPARYVIETKAGLVEQYGISLGTAAVFDL